SIPETKTKIIKEESSQIIELVNPPCSDEMDVSCDVDDSYLEYDKADIMVKSETPKLFSKGASMPVKAKVKMDEKKKSEEKMVNQPVTTISGGASLNPPSIQPVYDEPASGKMYTQSGRKQIEERFSLNNLSMCFKEYYNYSYTDFIPETKIDTRPQISVNNHFLNGTSPAASLGGYDYRYKIASHLNEIPSINTPVQLGVDIKSLKLDIIHTTIPLEKETVYLKGKFTNNGVSPYPSGPAQIFVDNQFLGNIILPTLASNYSTQISLGIDRDIKVIRKEQSERRTSGMFLGSDVITDYTIEIELQSFKEKPIKIEVFDRIPLSAKEKEIFIIDEKFDIKPVKITKRKILLWEIELSPKEKKVIKFGYSIKHSENYRLTMTKSASAYYETEE
ncbi:MAG TPA: DUF4139 domain-containing protein, partial [Spirochaetota bacterium]|nr:DUF4139 domain-containing protein [Spirochaetota bacterium]